MTQNEEGAAAANRRRPKETNLTSTLPHKAGRRNALRRLAALSTGSTLPLVRAYATLALDEVEQLATHAVQDIDRHRGRR